MIALARIWALDNDVNSNYGVSDTTAQSILNTLISMWMHQVLHRNIYIAASTSGLSLNSGDSSVLVSAGLNYDEFADAYQQTTNAVTFPLPRPMIRRTVREIIDLYALSPTSSPSSGGTEWSEWAAERTTDNQDRWRIWVYPTIQQAGFITLKAQDATVFTTGTDVPDVPYEHGVYISRLLAGEMVKLNGGALEDIESILSVIPDDMRKRFSGQAIAYDQLQDGFLQIRD
jgi:hypothetical protein